MTTSENAATVTVDQLPELPEGFHWKITSNRSAVEDGVTQTHLWIRKNLDLASENADDGYSMNAVEIVAWANITRGSKWIQNPTLKDFTVHAEGLLAKTSNRWALGLPTELEAPQI